MRRHDRAAGLLALAGWLAMATPAAAFECPIPWPLTRPGVRQEGGATLPPIDGFPVRSWQMLQADQ
jgi:hypothetical protein